MKFCRREEKYFFNRFDNEPVERGIIYEAPKSKKFPAAKILKFVFKQTVKEVQWLNYTVMALKI
jgi:hypothetical protein